MRDDLGAPYHGRPPRRVVSLVPSITEAVAEADANLLVAATDYCTHPAELDVPRVGGSKYPSIDKVLQHRPDLVLANAEENRKSDVEQLREAGIAVWVTFPRTVSQACDSAERMFTGALGLPAADWIDRARRAWDSLDSPAPRRAVVPIWRRPWMALGPGTFAGDVLQRLGVSNVYGDAERPYPKITVDGALARRPDLVVLPDEPYAFSASDGPEAFAGIGCALVSGRHLTWHGPSLADAPGVLAAQLDSTI